MKSEQIHILIIPSWFPDSRLKFEVAPFIQEQIRGLIRKGAKVNVLHPNYVEYDRSRIFSRNELTISSTEDYSIYQINYFKRFSRLDSIQRSFLKRSAEKAFIRYIRNEGQPDIIHSHSVFFGGIVGNYLGKKYNIPHVITEHSTQFILKFESLTGSDKRQIAKHLNTADRVIFVSSFQRDKMNELFDLGRGNQAVIHNMVADQFFNNPKDPGNAPFTFACIGYLNFAKNHALLIDSFIAVRKVYPGTRLILIGDGALRGSIEEKIRTHDLEENVSITGFLNREQVRETLRQAHALVSSSRVETFGVNLIEALAMGLPVVTTDSGGPGDIINDRNGILAANNAHALAEGMIRIIREYDNFDNKWIQEDCKNRFSEEHISEQILKLYGDITK